MDATANNEKGLVRFLVEQFTGRRETKR